MHVYVYAARVPEARRRAARHSAALRQTAAAAPRATALTHARVCPTESFGLQVLARVMEAPDMQVRGFIAGANVLEVGAGLGMIGMAAALLGARQVVVTDRAEPAHARMDFISETT